MTGPYLFVDVEVSAIHDLTPGFRRFTFRGPSVSEFADPGFDQRIKIVFPHRDLSIDDMPRDEDWYATWRALPTDRRLPFRTYTTRAVRHDLLEIDVDMVVHDVAGPASAWIASAAVGDRVLILGPNARFEGDAGGLDFIPPAQTEHMLLVGDETAAPAIAVILEQLPPHTRGIAVVEVPTAADATYLPTHPGIDVRVIARESAVRSARMREEAAAAAAELAPPGVPHEIEEIDLDREILWEVPRHAKGGAALKRTSLYAWIAGEAGAITQLRRHLVGERGLDRRTVAFMGYWRLGHAEG